MVEVPVMQKESALDQMDRLQQQIAQRAYLLFLERGRAGTEPCAEWLTAEYEIIRRPTIELRYQDGTYAVSTPLAGLAPSEIRVNITPTELVVTLETMGRRAANGDALLSEFPGGGAFRLIRFPRPVDTGHAKAEYHNGVLTVTAPIVPR